MKNYGYKPEPIAIGKDYIFGGYGALGGEVLQANGQWFSYVPQGESQLNFGFDPQGCVSWGTLNALEILLKRQYGEVVNFADRFLTVASETTLGGNSPQKVGETLRKQGVVREEAWPITEDLKTWDAFYAPIDYRTYTLALEFVGKYGFKHEYVSLSSGALKTALQYSPLGVAVSAWQKGQDGLYISPFPSNHWVVLVGYREGEYWLVYDSYSEDGEYIKKLAWDYNFGAAKRYQITKQVKEESESWLAFLVNLVLSAFRVSPAPTPAPVLPSEAPVVALEPPVKPLSEQIYDAALSWLGKDASPLNRAPSEFSCAEAVANIVHSVIPNFPNDITYTPNLKAALKKHFEATLDASPGHIILSVTGEGNGNIKNGHAGIFGKDGLIMSNDSADGKWRENYNIDSWVLRFRTLGKYPIYFFRPRLV